MPAPRTCECMTCHTCRAREWARARYRLRAYGQWQPKADLAAVTDHLHQLRAADVGVKAIANASGITRTRVSDLMLGKAKWVRPETAERILAVTPADAGRLPVWPVSRRLQALNAIGHSTYALGDLIGMRQEAAHALMVGERKWITRATDRAVREAYRRAHMTPGGSAQAIAHARRKGYRAPLDWDDIDAPEPPGEPASLSPGTYDPAVVERILGGDWRMEATTEERREVLRRWLATGRPGNELGRLTGWRRWDRYQQGAA